MVLNMVTREYDYLIVGAGLYGATCAYELTKRGKRCLVLEKRSHIGGNCYTESRDGINIHLYGPHIFHTSNEMVWKWINQFVEFNNFRNSPVAVYKKEVYSLPFSMWTFSKMWNIQTPQQAKDIIHNQSLHIGEPTNLEEQAIKLVGSDIYYKLIKGYTEKQWMKPAKELPKEIIKRLPVRFTYDNNYFTDKYQGVPIGGYTQLFNKLLDGIKVLTQVDYLDNKDHWNSQATNVIYTGPIDAFFNYRFGPLEYKTTKFVHKQFDVDNYQGCPVINYTEYDVPYTRTIEHKHFEEVETLNTWVTWEYPVKYDTTQEPYYPVNDSDNNAKYGEYLKLANKLVNIQFGGRLAEYRYYDMHKVIESALNYVNTLQ